jgi:alanine dehydrogenase
VVIGGGVVGTHAARIAAGMGADVTVLDRSLPRLRYLDDTFAGLFRTGYASGGLTAEMVAQADLLIGAVLVPGAVPVTSAQALNNATLPFVIKLANKGVAAFDDDPHLAAGLNVRDGRITHPVVAASLGFDRGPSTKGKVRLVAAE